MQSHSIWVRGLKRKYGTSINTLRASHSIWVRGLKLFVEVPCSLKGVALYMGAWIETEEYENKIRDFEVALYMGAWIETAEGSREGTFGESHSIWVRGLKPPALLRIRFKVMSHSIWVRGLKLVTYSLIARLMSRTLYGCVD